MKKFLFLFFPFLFCFSAQQALSQSIVINEVSQGPSGSKEYVEFLVTGTPTCDTIPCLDLRLWIFDDNNGYLNGTATTGVGIASGACRFANNAFWSCIPAGTILLIYNDGDSNPSLPAVDTSMSDGNCQLAIPISSTLFESHSSQPNSSNGTYPATGWTAGGSWTPISMANSEDGFQIYSATNTTTPVFSIGWGSANTNGDIYISGSATDDVFYATDCNFTSGASWTTGCAGDISSCGSDDQTPGVPNTAAQSTCIGQMNNNCTPITPLIADAGADTTICSGSSTTIGGSPTASGGVPVYSYTWSPATGLDSANAANPTATPSSTTTYVVTVQDSRGCDTTDTVTIIVNPDPLADAGADQIICPGGSTAIGGSPTATGAGPFTYSWSPATALSSSTTANPTASPSSTTTHVVTVTDTLGCTDSDTVDVIIHTPPVVSLGNDTTICQGASATLDAGTGYSAYNWSTSATTQTVAVNAAGTYWVQVTDSIGCTGTDTIVVSLSTPAVNLGNDTSFCSGDSVLLDAGAGYAAYNWSAGATSQSVYASSSGTYSVQVTDSIGCTAGDTINISINSNLLINIGNDTTVCNGQSVTFDAGTGYASYNWSTGATTQQITVGTSGTYSVQVTDAGGCTGADTAVLTVNPLPVADAGTDAQICFGDSVQIGGSPSASGSGPFTYSWSPVTGLSSSTVANPYSSAQDTTTYYLGITDANGCRDTDSVTVTVIPPLSLDIGNDTSFCAGDSLVLDAGAGFASYNWSTGETTQQVTVSTTGNYSVQVTGPSGCTASDTINVTVSPLPSVSFNAGSGCAGTSITFNNTSSISSGSISAYNWDFGDGSSSAVQSPSHTYSSGGSYSVILTAVSGQGCSDSLTQTVNVFYNPNAAFDADTVCEGTTTCFTDMSTVASGNISGWQWNFGDGSPVDNSQNPCHTYSTAGNYTAELIVMTDSGCTDTIAGTVTVLSLPTAQFNGPANVCLGDTAFFTDNSTGGATSYFWDFGDGFTSTQQNPTHMYSSAGTYTVELIVASAGCSDTTTAQVQVNPSPSPDFSAAAVCEGSATTFQDNSTGTIAAYHWDFGNGDSSAVQNPSYTYSSGGTYTVVLTLTNASGCKDSVAKQVQVHSRPTAYFPPVSGCVDEAIQFTDSSFVSGGALTSWSWDFGDGNTSAQQDPVHTYNASGNYDVQLVVTSAEGCTDTSLVTISVYPLPVPSFVSSPGGCAPYEAEFINTSTIDLNNTITTWIWDFGDGNTSDAENPVYTYNDAGTYDVILTAVSDKGCSASYTVSDAVEVYPSPKIDFEYTPEEISEFDPVVQFLNKSSGASDFLWSFGDGDSSSLTSPQHTYPGPGNYVVVLEGWNEQGCKDSAVKELEVKPEFIIYIPDAFTPNGNKNNDTFKAEGMGINEFKMRIFDRWGELIYTSTHLETGWNGTVGGTGEIVQTGVYVYKIDVTDVFGEDHSYIGRVTLLK